MSDRPPKSPLPSRRSALLALLLLAPAPSIGVAAAMVIAPGPVGQAVFTACKLWIVVFPAAWYLAVERGRPGWSPPRQGGLGVGTALGLAMAAAILLVYWLAAAERIDPEPLRRAVEAMELAKPATFLAGAAYWILVNSLLEEYVYRWFVLRQSEALLPRTPALLVSATVFTVHHVIALSVYLDPGFVVLGSIGVFGGGVVWAWCYQRYRSVWPGWISHVLADVAVFGIGWWIVFGG